MVGIQHGDAVRYAQVAGCRLPTALEWERAARGADGRRSPWGPRWDAAQAVIAPAAARQPVADRGVSAEGVADLIGNVWEWTATAERLTALACGGCWRNDGATLAGWSQQRFPADLGHATVGLRLAAGI